MKIRRILATAVAAAVTTPVVLLSAAPAFADTKPAAQTQNQTQDIEKLRLAVVKAQAAYDAAVAHVAELKTALDEFDKNHPELVTARADARKASDEAAAAKTAADQKLADAQKAMDELPADATDDQKVAAAKALADAQTEAATAKTTADAKAAALADAQKAYDDARVALVRDIGVAQKAVTDAKKALDAAQKALEEAEKAEPGDEDCQADKSLVTSVTGPKKITAGTSGVFTFRVTNKGKVELGEVGGYAEAFALDEDLDPYLHLTWSSATSPKWQAIDGEDGFSSLSSLKPGKSFDFKLKVAVDAKAPAGDGVVVAGGAYMNEDGSCGYDEEGSYAEFGIVKAHKPGTGNGGSAGGNGNTSPQGGQSTAPVATGTSGSGGSTGGSLATTGAGSSTLPIALAGGAAVVLGAGAMVVVRRRKAGAGA
ncbi:LPXTG cell wall anchor domain-containing protein [Streptomyces sp. NPDC053541]|uniref:LPXTG cell wall anchor domain-containing protein n=1 Tax=Streptomyces sp. NPDC053541 TaxID=3365709 RepID=UPI0037D745EE